jgi:hypothetical protein
MPRLPWRPDDEEVRRIVAELRPVIDECERRSTAALAVESRRRWAVADPAEQLPRTA